MVLEGGVGRGKHNHVQSAFLTNMPKKRRKGKSGVVVVVCAVCYSVVDLAVWERDVVVLVCRPGSEKRGGRIFVFLECSRKKKNCAGEEKTLWE